MRVQPAMEVEERPDAASSPGSPCSPVLGSTLSVTLSLDDGEGKDREGDILLDEPVHRELERTGCAAHRHVPRTGIVNLTRKTCT